MTPLAPWQADHKVRPGLDICTLDSLYLQSWDVACRGRRCNSSLGAVAARGSDVLRPQSVTKRCLAVVQHRQSWNPMVFTSSLGTRMSKHVSCSQPWSWSPGGHWIQYRKTDTPSSIDRFLVAHAWKQLQIYDSIPTNNPYN